MMPESPPVAGISVAQALAAARALGVEALDAQLLLLEVLGRSPTERAWLHAHDTDTVPAALAQAYLKHCRRRAHGEPLAYLVGSKEFFGLSLRVDARVLVPRPDTETLVEWALDLLPTDGPARVLDLGTGSGAIALALQHSRPALQVQAVDASHDALAVAQANAQRLGLRVDFRHGHWLDAVEGRFDLIASNPPYIAEADPHLEALRHEPLEALTAGADGLDDIRQIIDRSRDHLAEGGWLLLEHGYDQAGAVRQLMTAAGFDRVQSRNDLAQIERCCAGQWRGRKTIALKASDNANQT